MILRIVFIAILVLVLIEIGLFALAGQFFGVVPVLLSVVVSAVLGVLVIRWHGLATLRRLQATVQRGELPGRPIADAMLIGIAGVLLIVPGYFTDLCALLLLLPPVRGLIYRQLAKRFRVVPPPGPPPDPTLVDLDPDRWRER